MIKLAFRYMKKQKRRSVFTILGVTLAVTLVTCVGIFFTSFQQMMLHQAARNGGAQDFSATKIDEQPLSREQGEKILSHYLVAEGGLCGDGTLQLAGNTDSDDPILLTEYEQGALAMFEFDLTQGRLPQNGEEAIVGEYLEDMFPVGSQLSAGVTDTSYPDQSGSPVTQNLGRVSLRVVGVFAQSALSGQVITGGLASGITHTTFEAFGRFKPGLNKAEALKKVEADTGVRMLLNENYLQWKGLQANGEMNAGLLGAALGVCLVILFCMALVIHNSFSMSVAEKLSQIGTLRCIGATSKQIRRLTLSEAVLIWAAALLPGCGLAIGAMAVTFHLVRALNTHWMRFLYLNISPLPFLLAALLSLLTVLLCALLPAMRASRVSPIDAVRGNAAFRERSRRLHRGKLMQRLGGTPGMLASRNIRRNNGRYRTTVVSVMAGVFLFVCLGGFFQSTLQGIFDAGGADEPDFLISASPGDSASSSSLHALEQELSSDPNLLKSSSVTVSPGDMRLHLPDNRCTPDYKKYLYMTGRNEVFPIRAYIINRSVYNQLETAAGAPGYDQLVADKTVLFTPKILPPTVSGKTLMTFSTYQPGDTLPLKAIYRTSDPSEQGTSETREEYTAHQKEWDIPVKIGGFLRTMPWFSHGSDMQYPCVVVPEETAQELLRPEGTGEGNWTTLHLKAKPGTEETLGKRVEKLTTRYGLPMLNRFEERRNMRGNMLIVSLFIYVFLTVIALICAINLFNTVSANLQNRNRELAMLRATGMDKKQLRRMLLLESGLYGCIGSFWGGLIGIGAQAVLLLLLYQTLPISLFFPLTYLLGSFVCTMLISLLASAFSIRRLLRQNMIDGIRAQE